MSGTHPAMVYDPEFEEVGQSKQPRERRRRRWRRALLLPLLLFSGCHMLMTGSPVPLWSLEHLDPPVKVTTVSEQGLVLADGRLVRLPMIKHVPAENLTFRDALKKGVEVRADGEVFGLIPIKRTCGNDPYMWVTRHINLSDLAGGLDPDALDESIVHPAAIEELKEMGYKFGYEPPGSYLVLSNTARASRIRQDALARRQEANPTYIIKID